MPYTTVGYSASQDEGAIMTKIAAVADQHIKTSGNVITVSAYNQIVGVYAALGSTADECRLVAPSLRRLNPLYVTPIEGAIAPSADPLMMYFPANPIGLDINESLEVENDADPAAAEQHTVVVFLADGAISPVTGPIFTINAHATVALVAGSWEFAEIVFPDSLPVGDYQVVGARFVSADAVAFRFVPVGAYNRPGGISAASVSGKDPWAQRFGRMGEWFSFNTVQPPGVEVLSSAAAASATYEIYLDVLKR